MPKKTNKLNKNKKFTESSKRWILRQINDPLVKKAQDSGYRSRAAFKIVEIDDKFKIFKPGKIIVDLGAAPGGWSQVAVERCGEGNVFGIDLLAIDPIPGAILVQQDFLDETAPQKLRDLIRQNTGAEKCDVVLSDMAANTTGDKSVDHLRIITLLEDALMLAVQILKPGGSFAGKLFQGGSNDEIIKILRDNFEKVKYFKPESSRKDSSEIYLVALNFKSTI